MKLVIHNASPIWGGKEKWVTLVASGLVRRGNDVVISCRAGGFVEARARAAGVRTSTVRPGGELDVVRGLRFARWLRREAPDVVMASSWNRIPWIARAVGRRGPRLVVRLGDVRALEPRDRYARPFRTRVSAMIVNSAEIRSVWLDAAPWFPAERVHLVQNGIVPPAEGSLAGCREAVRAELGIGDAPLVVGVGHVFRRKGFDVLIEAFAAAAVPGAHLAIVGTGAHEPELRDLAAARGIERRLHWLGFRDDVPAILSAADVFVLSSRSEGTANVMLEAMAVGTPVVATDISGVRYALAPDAQDPEPAGWIVPSEEPAAMAAAIGTVLRGMREDPDAVQARVAAARRRIRERFDTERMVGEVERILLREIGGGGAR